MAKRQEKNVDGLKTEMALCSGHQMAKRKISRPELLQKVSFVLHWACAISEISENTVIKHNTPKTRWLKDSLYKHYWSFFSNVNGALQESFCTWLHVQRMFVSLPSSKWHKNCKWWSKMQRTPQRDWYSSIPAGMSAKVIKPVKETKKSIVLGQSDTVVFHNTRRERGEFSVNSFEAIILMKRCRDQKQWRQSSVQLRGQTLLVVCHCAQTSVPTMETSYYNPQSALWCASVNYGT